MTVERSELGVLTTNSTYQNTTEWTYTRYGLLSSSWTQEDNYTISYRFGATINVYPIVWKYATFAPSTSPNYDLEWALVTYKSDNANVVATESAWYPVNTDINFASPVTSEGYTLRAKIYVRRVLDENGDRPQLSRSSINNCALMFVGNLYQTIEEQTLPSDWFNTTVASFQNPMDTYTTIIPTDYDISSSQYDPLLEIPSKIDTAINFIILGFGRIMNFRYITFVVCFVLIVGLVAWLIH